VTYRRTARCSSRPPCECDVAALADRLRALRRDAAAGERALAAARALSAPDVVASGLAAVYDGS
jgi:hypothetical protein